MTDNIKSVDQNNFQQNVVESKTPVLVDFWAPWCGPCKAVAPVVEELSRDYSNTMQFAKVNVDESPFLASKYSVMSIPTIIIFKDGKPEQHSVGMQSRAQLKKMIDNVLRK